MHYSTVRPETSLDELIRDVTNGNGDAEADPQRVHAFIGPEQDGNPFTAESNAHSYVWMSVEAWISSKCVLDAKDDEWVSFFKRNPTPY